MLEAPGRVLPRPMSLSMAPPGELGFLFEAIGPGTSALAELGPGDRIGILGPLGNGFRLDVDQPLLVGGDRRRAVSVSLPSPRPARRDPRLPQQPSCRGCGAGSERRGRRRADAGDRTAGAGIRRARVRPAPMLSAVRELSPGAQLAWEAPMACRVRRLLRLRRRDRRTLQAPVPGGPSLYCLTPPAASMRWPRPTWPAHWMPSSRRP